LHIYFDGDKKWYKRNRTMRVYVSFRDLAKLEGSGATELRFENEIKLPRLDIHISGASDLFGTLNVDDLSLNMSGASDAKLKGRAEKLSLECSGASDFKGYDLLSVNCQVQASGASDLQLHVDKELSADASGASSIYFKGNGVLKNIHTSGASEIARKD
ncbi:MAG TPA: head GIN domain-containing protein, partial [Ferruginibacter sp.]|nr:head GIN domain-containing protein [Ferruginibacter sp.]